MVHMKQIEKKKNAAPELPAFLEFLPEFWIFQ